MLISIQPWTHHHFSIFFSYLLAPDSGLKATLSSISLHPSRKSGILGVAAQFGRGLRHDLTTISSDLAAINSDLTTRNSDLTTRNSDLTTIKHDIMVFFKWWFTLRQGNPVGFSWTLIGTWWDTQWGIALPKVRIKLLEWLLVIEFPLIVVHIHHSCYKWT